MASSLFTLPIPLYQHTTNSRTALPGPKKRKRKGAPDLADLDETDRAGFYNSDPLSARSQQSSTISEYQAVVTPLQRHQYRIAGQRSDENPPRAPFPHTPLSTDEPRLQSDDYVRSRLQDLDPPLNIINARAAPAGLHQQHLAVMTAILHRSLLEKDFIRAGRALSIILRDEMSDLRSEARWGIGAEICLRQGAQIISDKQERQFNIKLPDRHTREPADGISRPGFTRKGFEDAKRYYENLIIQHPFHKPNPGAVSALDFYLALFGLWIYVVQEESNLYNVASDPYGTDVDGADDFSASQRMSSQRKDVGQRELAQAREIAERMDSCMANLPYRDDLQLMGLRAMVALWIADIYDDLGARDWGEADAGGQDRTPMDHLTDSVKRVSLGRSPGNNVDAEFRLHSARSRQLAQELFDKVESASDG